MPRPRLAVKAVTTAVAIAVPAMASIASAVTVGENFTANTDCDGITVIKTVPQGGNSYEMPSDGVLTSWSTNAQSGGNLMAAAVYRLAGGNYELVGTSDREVPTGAGLKTYSTSISVRQGDLLGSWVEQRSGAASVRFTCVGGGGSGYTTSWWYGAPANQWPPASVVSIASIGSTLTGNSNDSGWRYDISAELTPAAPAPSPSPGPTPTPDPATPSTPGTSSESATGATPTAGSEAGVAVATPQALPRLAGRWTRPSARGVVRTRGTMPAGATRVVQTARPVGNSRATATQDFLDMVATNARRTGACATSGSSYRCVIRLSAGRWTITTSAMGATGVVARSTRGVVVRPAQSALRVTG